jgi:hypothetical protein
MNDHILDSRFAIYELARARQDASCRRGPVSLTPRFSGVLNALGHQNRFSGFERLLKTAKAVEGLHNCLLTPLTRGVNEASTYGISTFVARPRLTQAIGLAFSPKSQIVNRKS